MGISPGTRIPIGEEPEELALWAGETEPGPEEQGILLFLEP